MKKGPFTDKVISSALEKSSVNLPNVIQMTEKKSIELRGTLIKKPILNTTILFIPLNLLINISLTIVKIIIS